jgi:hypothetical protein
MGMRLPLVLLGIGAFGSSGCASKYHYPATVYWVDLKEPQPIELVSGEKVPCGRGLAMAVHDRLLGCIIDRGATIQDHDFPAGAALCFRWDGTLERARSRERQGTLPNGDGFLDTRVTSFDRWGDVTGSTVERWRGTTTDPLPDGATPWCLR